MISEWPTDPDIIGNLREMVNQMSDPIATAKSVRYLINQKNYEENKNGLYSCICGKTRI